MKRFKIGDDVRIIYSQTGKHIGKEAKILAVGPIRHPNIPEIEIDYAISINGRTPESDGLTGCDGWFVLDEWLEPITKHKTGSWEELESLGWTRPEIKTNELSKD